MNSCYVWVGVHFGSRGLGHKTASGFLALTEAKRFEEHATEGEMDSPPILFGVDNPDRLSRPLRACHVATQELPQLASCAGSESVATIPSPPRHQFRVSGSSGIASSLTPCRFASTLRFSIRQSTTFAARLGTATNMRYSAPR